MTKHKISVRVLLYQENNMWIVQCWEYDFASQGGTTKRALDGFERLFLGQISLDIEDGIEPLSELEPAPVWRHEIFEKANLVHQKEARTFNPVKDSFQHLVEPALEDLRIYA
jgi:hypothetical protein